MALATVIAVFGLSAQRKTSTALRFALGRLPRLNHLLLVVRKTGVLITAQHGTTPRPASNIKKRRVLNIHWLRLYAIGPDSFEATYGLDWVVFLRATLGLPHGRLG